MAPQKTLKRAKSLISLSNFSQKRPWKRPDAGKGRKQEEKGTTEDKTVRWHHQLNGHEFEQALGDCEGQGSLACSSPWGCKELDMTEQLNNNNSFRNSLSPIPLTTDRILLCTHSSQVCLGTLTLCNANLVNSAVKALSLPLPDIPAQPHHKSSKPV